VSIGDETSGGGLPLDVLRTHRDGKPAAELTIGSISTGDSGPIVASYT